MNKEWSEENKTVLNKISKKATFQDGIARLIQFREQLTTTLYQLKNELKPDEFTAIPFINAPGYHNKTIAYSIWHIFRIEDIVAHTLICEDDQIFFLGEYQKKICSPIITTGNELVKQQIADFSKQLNIDELYNYATQVKNSTNEILKNLTFEDLNRKVSLVAKANLETLKVVSQDENAVWLIDYWCDKTIKGLIQMPFSRHWLMHIEAILRIKNKINNKKK